MEARNIQRFVARPLPRRKICADAHRCASVCPELERAQGYLKLPNGRSLTGKATLQRPGTTTLFAALEVATGKILAATLNPDICADAH